MTREPLAGVPELLMQMKITNRLLAAQLRPLMTQQGLIALLSSTGATSREIAEIVNTTTATVKTTVARLKKKRGNAADE